MTEAELAALLAAHPRLYHMAACDSWERIRRHGLLSTSALLDLYGVCGKVRLGIESQRRSVDVALEHKDLGRAVIRDQGPMDDRTLLRCLRDGLTPADWYRMLNAKVFFWVTQERLLRLLRAKAYRDQAHDVLVLDSRALVAAYRDRIWLCPVNSGFTRRGASFRGLDTFRRIEAYPFAEGPKLRQPVVELAVDHGVPDIARYVVRVVCMSGARPLCLDDPRSEHSAPATTSPDGP